MASAGRGTVGRDWLDYLPRRIRSGWRGQGFALLCLSLAFVLRLALTPVLHRNGPFFTFFPAVMIAAIWGGPLAGLTTLLGGALLAAAFWIAPVGTVEIAPAELPHLLSFVLLGGVVLLVAAALRSRVARQEAAEERALLLAQEMRHRLRNLMGLVMAISHQTGRQSANLQDFLERFDGRMEALSAALAQEGGAPEGSPGGDLDTLITRVLAPFGHERCNLLGPALPVPAAAAAAVALVLHELATNAVKYGALSVPEGRVTIEWRQGDAGVEIDWQEIGGPTVVEPATRGFGSRLIQSAFAQAQGEARLIYAKTGVQCRMRFQAAV